VVLYIFAKIGTKANIEKKDKNPWIEEEIGTIFSCPIKSTKPQTKKSAMQNSIDWHLMKLIMLKIGSKKHL